MSSRRKPPTLDYAGPDQISLLQKLAPFRWLFWPLGAMVFLLTFVGLAGNGAAAGVYEAIVHLPLLGVWLLSAYGWGVALRSLARMRQRDALVTITTIAAGLGAMSLAILGLGLIGAFNRPVAI